MFDISKAQRIGAVVMSLNRYQQLLTSLLTSVTQIDTIFFIILAKDKKKTYLPIADRLIFLHNPLTSERKLSLAREYDVVEDFDVEQRRSLRNFARQHLVGGTRLGSSRGVVVRKDDLRGE